MISTSTLRPLVAPLAIAAVAVGFLGRVAWRAVELDSLPAVRRATPMSAQVLPARSTNVVDIAPAVELDPFRADRQKPLARYALPGDAPAPNEQPPANPPASVSLLGTVMSLDGSSFAMVGMTGSPPRVMRVGQTIGNLTLRTIEQGRAVFRSATGETVEVRVSRGGQ